MSYTTIYVCLKVPGTFKSTAGFINPLDAPVGFEESLDFAKPNGILGALIIVPCIFRKKKLKYAYVCMYIKKPLVPYISLVVCEAPPSTWGFTKP